MVSITKIQLTPPSLEIAQLTSAADLQWLIDSIRAKDPFHSLFTINWEGKKRVVDDESIRSFEVNEEGNSIVWTSYHSGYGNSVDERKHTGAQVGDFVLWNQLGKAYLKRGKFSGADVPEELRGNVLVLPEHWVDSLFN